jgi:hypothetical protein
LEKHPAMAETLVDVLTGEHGLALSQLAIWQLTKSIFPTYGIFKTQETIVDLVSLVVNNLDALQYFIQTQKGSGFMNGFTAHHLQVFDFPSSASKDALFTVRINACVGAAEELAAAGARMLTFSAKAGKVTGEVESTLWMRFYGISGYLDSQADKMEQTANRLSQAGRAIKAVMDIYAATENGVVSSLSGQ